MKILTKLIAVSSLIIGTLAATTTTASTSQPPVTTSNAKLAQIPQQEVSKEKPTFEENNYRFELQNCQRVQKVVTCTLLITNLDNKDKEIELYGNHNYADVPRPQIADFSGNEYVIKNVYIGQNQAGRYEVSSRLVSNVPKKINITIELPPQVNKLAVFEIVYRDGKVQIMGSGPIGKVQFRNVDIVATKPNSVSSNNRKKK